MTEDDRATVERQLGNRYQIIRTLGAGAFGAVYLARERDLHRLVAIKVLRGDRAWSDEERERLLREARTLANLSHPAVVPLLAFGESNGMVYMVMPYVSGQTLADRLAHDEPFDADEVRRILIELADALAYVHGEGVLHRDLKPENVLLERAGAVDDHIPPRVRLIDFGVAAFPMRDPGVNAVRETWGTPHFMAPEQMFGGPELDARSEIYSLGVLGFLLLGGRLPFDATSPTERLTQQRRGPVVPLSVCAPDAPKDLARAIERCLAYDAEQRWRRARDFRDTLIAGASAGNSFTPLALVRQRLRQNPAAIERFAAKRRKRQQPRLLQGAEPGMSTNRGWRERIEVVQQDMRFALRTLRKNAAFTAVAVLTLALGIGMNSAIFSVVNGVLLKPLPFARPEQLLRVWQVEAVNGTTVPGVVSAVNLDDWRARRKVIADMGGYFYREGMSGTDLTGLGEPQRVAAAFITPGFWNTLGVNPALGRLPRDEETVRGANDRLVVLGYDYWQRQFGGATSVIGKRVTLGGDSYEVVGVTPREFRFPSPRVEMFMSYSTIPDNGIPRVRPSRILEVVARMKPGATVAQANAEMNGITRGLAEQYPENKNLAAATVAPLRDAIVGKVRTTLLVLLGAVGFVLLIAAVNLASLMLARATTREREFAIRVALGAERGQIIRQLFAESLVLATLGGLLGIIVAQLGGRLLVHLAAGQLPRAEDVGIDYRVLLFTLAISLATGVAFGLVPAIRASSPDLQQSLRKGSRGSTIGSGGARSALVIAEVALALVLVVGAGLMTRSFVKLMQVDLGFKPDHRIALNYSINSKPSEMRQTYRDILEKVRTVPGVVSAGAIRDLPFHGDGEDIRFMAGTVSGVAADQRPSATLMFTSDGFFSAMGIPLLAGRDLSPQDREGAPLVFVVNQALAKKYFPGQNAVGQMLTLGGDTSHSPIVGVVGDVHQGAVDETPTPRIYESVYQVFRSKTNLVVRTQGDPALMIKKVEDAIRTVDPQQTFTSAFTLEDSIGEAVARPRLLMVLLGLFGVMGLVLGALGLYGVLSYLVNQRTREIGVRLALGAQRGDVLGMVVGRGLRLAAIGVGVGLIGALVLTRLMQGVLYGVTARDPLTFGGVAVVLLAVAALASWVPAVRATRVDPVVALRAE